MNPAEEIIRCLCERRVRTHAREHPTFTTLTKYAAHRDAVLQRDFRMYFDAEALRGRRVIDFGCGSGDLSMFVCEQGAASVTGIDLSEKFVALARNTAELKQVGNRVSFVIGRRDAIPLAETSADAVLCFDVMEHVLDYTSIIREWYRVLVPGGKVFIAWRLWMHPYSGHHCYPLVNVPWAHLLLSDAALLRICARVYELAEYRPSFWHLDEHGRKKSNPFGHTDTLEDYVNKLTSWRFERVSRHVGFKIARREFFPFSGDRAARLKRFLASLPFLSDAFSSAVVYELEKPSSRLDHRVARSQRR